MNDPPEVSTDGNVAAEGPQSSPTARESRDGLQRFCEAVLDVLREGPDEESILPPVLHGLASAIRAGSRDVADRLRGEIRTWQVASESLLQLSRSSFVAFGGEAVPLLAKLERARRQATVVAGALDGMLVSAAKSAETADETDGAGLEQAPGDAPQESSATCEQDGGTVRDPEPYSLAQPDAGGQDTDEREPESPEADRAEALYREGESRRRERDFAAAEALYTEALRLNPGLRSAYLCRGRVRILRSQPELAIDDLTVALESGGDDAVVNWWRGDALALAGRHGAAVADYTRALASAPGLFLPRYNRAVSLRLGGDRDRALAEFDELLQLRPEHGPLYLNRSLIFLACGDLARAAADLRTALRYQPESKEAAARLHEVNGLLRQQTAPGPDESAERPPPPDGLDSPPDVCAAVDVPSEPSHAAAASNLHRAGQSSPPAPGPPPVPAGARRRPETRKPNSPAFPCPGCRKVSAVRWDRLDLGKVLGCPHCKDRFTAKVDGRLVKVVRDRQGRWVDVEWAASRSRRTRTKRYQFAAGVLAAGLCVYALAWTPKVVERLTPAAVEAGLPKELEPRAERFARAWLKGDVPRMRELTDPVQDRMLFAWYKRNPPPGGGSAVEANQNVKVAIEELPGNPSGALLRVRFEGLQPRRDMVPVELQLTWQERGGSWIFQPVPDLKLQVGL
jgi:tetratricopeptide (TPR) repeat protein